MAKVIRHGAWYRTNEGRQVFILGRRGPALHPSIKWVGLELDSQNYLTSCFFNERGVSTLEEGGDLLERWPSTLRKRHVKRESINKARLYLKSVRWLK